MDLAAGFGTETSLAVGWAGPACCREMDLKRRAWLGIAEVGMAFAGLIVGYFIVASVLEVFDPGPYQLLVVPLMTGLAAAFYAWVGPQWAAATRDEGDPGPDVSMPPSSLSGLRAAMVVVVGIAAALGGSIVLGLLLELVGFGVQEQSRVLEITGGARDGGPSTEALVLAVSALLMAPIAEEWLFRRLLFVRVRAASGSAMAYGLSALGFAAIHGNPTGILIYFWLGLVFAAVLERTGRLWAAIAVHMGNNAYVLAVLFFGAESGI